MHWRLLFGRNPRGEGTGIAGGNTQQVKKQSAHGQFARQIKGHRGRHRNGK